MLHALFQVRDFLEAGGWALTLIAFTTLVLWSLILERSIYFRAGHRRLVLETLRSWKRRGDKHSWHAMQVRRLLISRVVLSANRSTSLIRAIIAVCPLMGLLGTVTGMIEVYDVMAIEGSGNARAMASGVSKAMITTIAGLVAALSGLFAMPFIDRYLHALQMDLASALRVESDPPESARASRASSSRSGSRT